MATLVLTAVGATIGASVGGVAGSILAVVGAYAGSQVGGAIDREIFGIAGGRTVEGPRLGDLSVQSSSYGQAIPLIYGAARVAGNVIWSTGLVETRHEESKKVKGGKGGGSTRVTNVTYTYSVSFAVALCARAISGIGRIWADGKLLRDATGPLAVDGVLRIYSGDEEQVPDPLMEAMKGIGNVPAYRGMAYVVFENLALAEYANRIPNLTFEVIADTGGTASLAMVVRDLSIRAGLQTMDASALGGDVSGFVVGRQMTYRQALELLAQAYRFDVTELNGALVFAPLDRTAVANVVKDDLVRSSKNGPAVASVRKQEVDLPREVAVRHIDNGRNYQAGIQRARRTTTASQTVVTLDLPLVLSAGEAKRAAEVELALQWLRREGVAFSLPIKWAALTPGDVITLDMDGGAFLLLILDEVQFGGGRLQCRATPYAPEVLGSAAVGDGGAVPTQTVPSLAATVLHLLNLPSVTADDAVRPAFYAALTSPGSGWRGAVLYQSIDAGASYDDIAAGYIPAVAGVTSMALAEGPSAYWDEGNTLTVSLLSAAMNLESRPSIAVLNGANAALVGDEIIQFRNATLDMSGDWILSGLLRGRRGTEGHIGAHSAGERFILLESAAIIPIETTLGALGREDLYKAVSIGGQIDDITAVSFSYAAANLQPFSPAHITGSRDESGNLTITWIRRSRIGGAWIDGADAPIGEESEAYDIDIMNGSTVVRTLNVISPSAIYAAAAQVMDFGSLQTSVEVIVYQRSAIVGRGVPAMATV